MIEFTREIIHSEFHVVWFPPEESGLTSNTWGRGVGGVLSVPQIGEFRHLAPYDPEHRFRIDWTPPQGARIEDLPRSDPVRSVWTRNRPQKLKQDTKQKNKKCHGEISKLKIINT